MEADIQSLEIEYLQIKGNIVENLIELYKNNELRQWCYTDRYGNIGELQKGELSEVLLQIEGVRELDEIYDYILNLLVKDQPYEIHLLL